MFAFIAKTLVMPAPSLRSDVVAEKAFFSRAGVARITLTECGADGALREAA